MVTVRGRRAVLLTDDGVRIDALYEPRAGAVGPRGTGTGGVSGDPSGADPPGAGAGSPSGGPSGLGAESGAGAGSPSGGPSGAGAGSPSGGPSGAGPAIVVAHGFSGALERPALRRAAAVFGRYAAVVTFSFRGHGGSGGRSTVGDREVLDLAAVVGWARRLGHRRIATVGFSMGGSVVLRHAALCRPPGESPERPEAPEGDGGRPQPRSGLPSASAPGPRTEGAAGAEPGCGEAHTDAVVAVSAPARWYYRGTAPMRRLHWAVTRPAGRLVTRYGLRTRIHPYDWDPVPLAPFAAVPLIAPTPLLIVHGDRDPYFPLDHPRMLADAGDPSCTRLWIEPGIGHAENAMGPELLHRIAAWATVPAG